MIAKGVSVFRLLLNSNWKPQCSFCGCEREDPGTVIAGPSRIYICVECADLCRAVFHAQGLIDAGQPWNFPGRKFKDKTIASIGGVAPNARRVEPNQIKTSIRNSFTSDDTPIPVKEPSWLSRHVLRKGSRVDSEGLRYMVSGLISENRTLRQRIKDLEEAKGQEGDK